MVSEMFQRQKMPTGSHYLSDESKFTGKAAHIITPYTEDEVREVMRVNNSKGNPVTIRGLGTGLCGGCVPQGGDVMTLEHLSGVVGLGRDDRGYYIRALPCTSISDIDRFLRKGDFSSLEELSEGVRDSIVSEGTSFMYPVDPTELGGSIGGNVATNASGPRTYRYGPTRDWVRGLRVVMVDGGLLEVSRGEVKAEGRRMNFFAGRSYYSFDIPSYDSLTGVKNAAGPSIHEDMDLVDLFIGSEGVFGTITGIDIYIVPRRGMHSVILFFPTDEDALGAVRDMRDDDIIDPEFIEYLGHGSLDLIRKVIDDDPALLRVPEIPASYKSAVFFDIPAEDCIARYDRVRDIAVRHNSSLDMSWCGTDDVDAARMRSLRHAVPRSVFEYVASLKGRMPSIHKMGTDMAVPDENADEMMRFYSERLEESGLEYVIFGHIGNNHPHVEIILRDMQDFEKAKVVYSEFAIKAVDLGGSPTAEHGIGKIKVDYMRMLYGEDALTRLTAIKRILDPKLILNRGVLIGDVQ